MFRRNDFLPYMISMFILGGLILLPFLFEHFAHLSKEYVRNLGLSMAICAVFAFAHKKDGSLSYGTLLGGIALMIIAGLRATAKAGAPQLILPGVLSFAVLWLCGWVGIFIARGLGISKKTDPPVSANTNATSSGMATGIQEESGPGNLSPNTFDMSLNNVPAVPEELKKRKKYFDLLAEPRDSAFYTLMHTTYETWRKNPLEHEGGKMFLIKKDMLFEEFSKYNLNSYILISLAGELRPFDDDEYFVNGNPGFYLLTSKAIYFFVTANKVFLHKDVRQYEFKKRLLEKDLHIELSDGQHYEFKNIVHAPSEEVYKKLMTG